ncbi:Glutamate synthase domain-containing protein 2 [Oceanospirillum multiglobuliferum]|uniref:FMN-binding glutamate synthase family protein n=1 Tax=Oceanospirillum multiglobuliferum TaxID=64969 RepID=A0A1T4PIS6_9GAMM|nr:FMN-binding glutamate synthase family protein [Oceanospirillum multiglobuliferum]OPX55549.1 FMN-binding glutamate synthase family protein [Oceanospirillum multiglobuliferum]SJZ90758.1 Glutamate synthase domain-containing protein 2 [Oceanospirillum multiglobuliferum]
MDQFAILILDVAVILFGLVLLAGIVSVLVMYIVDKNQTDHTIRRNFPVLGRFRYFFEYMGEFFRQYFFAMDREELPFNRAQRSWAYRAAKNVDNTVAFGSSRDIHKPGAVFFLNTPYPTLKEDAVESPALEVGPYCRQPFMAKSILNISGMSYGALSIPAVTALSTGAKMAGCWMNTGEGGLSPYHLSGGCDIVMQIGTAKYGVRDEHGQLSDDKLRQLAAIEQVRMFEIKLSQGAKPGKGGILPAEKVNAEIAEIRGIPVGKDSISPNRHPEINSPQDLLEMIARVREVTGKPVGIKFVLGTHDWLDELFTEINHRGEASAPDFITIDGAEGGTGAAPMPLMDSVGLSLKESLPLVVDMLKAFGLRDRVRVIASGKLINPTEVAWAIAIGADFCVTARGFMFALGCIQALQCNKNTCPSGITTHDTKLNGGLNPADKSVRVKQYHQNLINELGVIAHSCGAKEPRGLHRHHAHMVTATGLSENLARLYPGNYIPLREKN